MSKRSLKAKKVSRNVKVRGDVQVNSVLSNLDSPLPLAVPKCSESLSAYIHDWMSEENRVQQLGTTISSSSSQSLPCVTPLPSLLEVMMAAQVSTGSVDASCDPSASTAPVVQKDLECRAKRTGVVYDDAMLQHASSDPRECERPGRLSRLLDHLHAIGLLACCHRIPRRVARTKELRLVHTLEHIDAVDQLEFLASLQQGLGSCKVGQDLYASAGTSKAARTAAGCVIAAALSVVCGEVCNAFAFVRPPGHHSSANTASGFCFFNNVAVAVRVAQEKLRQLRATPAPRVLVLDWDVHHCDGTESIFYEDPSVVVVSIHQYYERAQGHVLRKTPTVFTDTIDLSTLAALMEESEKEKLNGDACDTTNENGSGQDASLSEKNTQIKSKSESSQETCGKMVTRPRKPVDYVKLAAELNEEGNDSDGAAAMMFSLRSRDFGNTTSLSLAKSSSGSNSGEIGSNGSSTSDSSSDDAPERISGDTEGISHEEEVDTNPSNLFYPGTGHMGSVGGDVEAEARGKNINVPWPSVGMGDLEYLQVLLDIVAPVVREYKPDIVFLSCGFDSAAGDLLGSMNLSASGYYILTRALAALCPRLVVALEGGYHLSNVARCTEAVLRALLESSGTSPLPRSGMLWCQTEELVRQVRRTHEEYWRCFSGTQ